MSGQRKTDRTPESVVRLVASIYQRRDDLKLVYGDRYAGCMKLAVQRVRERMRATGENDVTAALYLAGKAPSDAAQFILVAALEISESES